MAAIPEQQSATVKAIYAAYEKNAERRRSRRLGASILGRQCDRYLWLSFRWAAQEEHSGRMLRLFNTGHREEDRFVSDLRSIGCEVMPLDPATGQQWEFTAVAGHVVCKIDSAILNLPEAPKTWHVGEFKTHSSKSFAALAKGLLTAKPEHYAQCMVGMDLSKMERALYLAVNKDSDELYSERIKYNRTEAEALIARAESVIRAVRPLEKAGASAEALPCRFCQFKEHCHGEKVADVTCRSCVHATPVMDGTLGAWRCERHGKTITAQEQEKACPDHLFIPDLIPFAEQIDAGDGEDGAWIKYRNKDGTEWVNSKKTNDYKSIELNVLPASLVGAGYVDSVKQNLGAEVVGVSHE